MPVPWLLLHGSVLWQLALAAILSAAVAAAFIRTRRAARAEAQLARERLGVPLDSPGKLDDDMRVTLSGRLEARELCGRFDDGAPAAAASEAHPPAGSDGAATASVRAGDLAIVAGDTRVELTGPVEVVAGSREVHLGPRFPVRRSLASGDEVRVAGVLLKEAGAGEIGDYRATTAARWSLLAGGDPSRVPGSVVLRLAFEGAPRVVGPAPATYVLHLAAGAALFLALFGLGGEIAFASLAVTLHDFAHDDGNPRATNDGSVTAASIAAATPFRRSAAIEAMSDALDLRDDDDPVWIERRVALHTLRGECSAAASAVLQHEQLERGAEMAERCGQHADAAHAFYAAGEFARASASWERVSRGKDAEIDARFGARVHALAGRPALAADEARRLASALGSRGADQAPARCLADALDARAGNDDARARLVEGEKQRTSLGCAILVADVRRGAGQKRVADAFTDFTGGPHAIPVDWLELLAVEGDPALARPHVSRVLAEPSLLVANPSEALHDALPAVERAVAEALTAADGGPKQRARSSAAATAAVFAAIAGDAADARRLSGLARAYAEAAMDDLEVGVGGTWDPTQAAVLSSAVELALGDTAHARALLGPAHSYCRACEPLEALLDYRERGDAQALVRHMERWSLVAEGADETSALAARGDGTALVKWLRQPRSDEASFLRLGAPRLQKDEDKLLRWLRHGRRMPGWYRSPADQLVYWMNLAAGARGAGDEALAGALRARAARFREALLRRDLAVPLAVLERL